MSPIENNDNRQYQRIFYKAEATLSCDERTWPCEITDLSLKGCLLRLEFPWEENLEKIYTLTLHLPDQSSIKMALTATHVVGNNVGFKCEHIDMNSISGLHHFIELNLGDSKLLERDLLALTE